MRSVLSAPDIDELLGPSSARFFGSGYRKANYVVTNGEYDGTAVRASLAVTYPAAWSQKRAGIDLRPHLSTVDCIVLASRLADLLLVAKVGLSGKERKGALIEKMVIQAGVTPEEDLQSLPMLAEVTKTLERGASELVTTVLVRIGSMRTRLTVSHPRPAEPRPLMSGPLDIDSVLGAAEASYWADGFKSGQQRLADVQADVATLKASARLTTNELPGFVTEGLGGRPDGTTQIDVFVSVLQLVQVLIYELDSVRRADSNTLWMQRATIQLSAGATDQVLRVHVTDTSLLDLAGGQWRNIEFEGSAGSFDVRSVFAHQLPVL